MPLAQALKTQGYITSEPVLKGHEGLRREMGKATRRQWIATAETAYVKLQETCADIVVVGFSTGGLIAAQLAQRHEIKALIFISVPFIHWDLRRVFINIHNDFKTRRFDKTRWYLYSATSFPLKALLEFKRLQHDTKPLFSKVKSPVLILQGKDDDTVNWKSAEAIESRISGDRGSKDRDNRNSPQDRPPMGNRSAQVEKAYFEPAGHVMLQGPAALQVTERILLFLRNLN